MNSFDERRVEGLLGKPCHMAQNRNWLYDNYFVPHEDEDSCGYFSREIKYKDGFIAISVELSSENGLCTATIEGVATNAMRNAIDSLSINEYNMIMDKSKQEYTSEYAEEAVKNAVLGAMKREEFIIERAKMTRSRGSYYDTRYGRGGYGGSTMGGGYSRMSVDDDNDDDERSEEPFGGISKEEEEKARKREEFLEFMRGCGLLPREKDDDEDEEENGDMF